MWLINAETIQLHEFSSSNIPKYAILSHTWGDNEVLFKDMTAVGSGHKEKAGFYKIEMACKQALADEYSWIWVDTCCIDKSSSAELTEAINSMYMWYERAGCCYAYLEDVLDDCRDTLKQSRWFTRGWTLQELLAPSRVIFFSHSWTRLGQKLKSQSHMEESCDHTENERFLCQIETATGIPKTALTSIRTPRFPDMELPPYSGISIAQRMSWASGRSTTRPEDLAYCLMGLFDVNIPILYGEGLHKAFRRLQLEIIKLHADQSIFAWDYSMHNTPGLLARSPAAFRNSGSVTNIGNHWAKFEMTNVGLSIQMPLRKSAASGTRYMGLLGCSRPDNKGKPRRIMIWLNLLARETTFSPARFMKSPKYYQRLLERLEVFRDDSVETFEPTDVVIPEGFHFFELLDSQLGEHDVAPPESGKEHKEYTTTLLLPGGRS